MNTSVLSLDARGANRAIYTLIGPLLQPETREKQASLKPVDVTDEFLQGVGHGGCRRVHRGPRAVALVLWQCPGETDRRSARHRSKFPFTRHIFSYDLPT
jgi:hypothetical protein